MDFETYWEICYGVDEAPADEAPADLVYDPYYEEQYSVDCYLADVALEEAHISSLLGEEVKL